MTLKKALGCLDVAGSVETRRPSQNAGEARRDAIFTARTEPCEDANLTERHVRTAKVYSTHPPSPSAFPP